jgi:hypothetical protein
MWISKKAINDQITDAVTQAVAIERLKNLDKYAKFEHESEQERRIKRLEKQLNKLKKQIKEGY